MMSRVEQTANEFFVKRVSQSKCSLEHSDDEQTQTVYQLQF